MRFGSCLSYFLGFPVDILTTVYETKLMSWPFSFFCFITFCLFWLFLGGVFLLVLVLLFCFVVAVQCFSFSFSCIFLNPLLLESTQKGVN